MIKIIKRKWRIKLGGQDSIEDVFPCDLADIGVAETASIYSQID